MSEVKRCKKDSSHIWMADIPFCPYCSMSSEARVYYAEQERKARREHEEKTTGMADMGDTPVSEVTERKERA